MAFCNACGSSVEQGAKFCSKCGSTQPSSAAANVGVPPAPAVPARGVPATQSSVAKPLLIGVAVILVLGVLAIAGLTLIGLHIARQTRVRSKDGNVRVETPFGSVESTNNSTDLARDLGVDIYPNARLQKGNAANISVAGMHTVAAEFETDDPVDTVANFYKAKFPNATINVSSANHYSIVSTQTNNLITITLEPRGGGTWIKVASITGKNVGSCSD